MVITGRGIQLNWMGERLDREVGGGQERGARVRGSQGPARVWRSRSGLAGGRREGWGTKVHKGVGMFPMVVFDVTVTRSRTYRLCHLGKWKSGTISYMREPCQ